MATKAASLHALGASNVPRPSDGDNWCLFELGTRAFGVPTAQVLEMVILEKTHRTPRMPPGARGVVSLRGRVIPVIDLRKVMGMTGLREELEDLEALLAAREADHLRWVDELRRSMLERQVFTLTTDPTKCAFGKWYGSFRTDNVSLRMVLERMDEPHRSLHAHGAAIVEGQKLGDCRHCEAELAAAEYGSLAELRQLFAEARKAIHSDAREVLIVVRVGEREIGLAVDSVTAVKRLSAEERTNHTGECLGDCEAWTKGFAITGGQVISLLDLPRIADLKF